MTKLGRVGAWGVLVGMAAMGCGSAGGGTGGSTTATTTATTSVTSTAGDGGTGGSTGAACPIESAACQKCTQDACSLGTSPPAGLQTYLDCMCTAQVAHDNQAAAKCSQSFSLQPDGSATINCIGNSCAGECS